MRATLFGLAASLLGLAASAAPHIEKLSVADGLPSPYPRDIVRSPNGVLWAPMMANQGLERIGLVRVEGTTVQWLHGTETGLGSDRVAAIAADAAGGLWAATDAGLFRTDTSGPSHFTRIGEAMPLRWVSAVPGGGAWAVSDVVPGARSLLAASASQARSISLPDACPSPVALHPKDLQSGMVICTSALIRLEGGVAVRRGTAGTSIELPKAERSATSERRQPLVWLYDTAPAADGIWLIGHTRRLTQLGPDGLHAVAEGRFMDLAHGPSHAAVVSDLDGGLFQWTGSALTPVPHGQGGVGQMWVDDTAGAVWAVVMPKDAAYRVERLPLREGGLPDTLWHLGEGAGKPSPGIVGITGDGAGGVWLATNEGLWHLVE